MRLADIWIQLQPNVSQRIGRFIGVVNFFGARQQLCLVIDFDVDDVVDLLLPVSMAGCARCDAVVVGRGQYLFQLTELINLVKLFDWFLSARNRKCASN